MTTTSTESADEWETVSVKGFDALMTALERADSKGYMPDAMADEWAAFDFRRASGSAAPAPTPEVERCECGYPMPCNVNVPVGFCRAALTRPAADGAAQTTVGSSDRDAGQTLSLDSASGAGSA